MQAWAVNKPAPQQGLESGCNTLCGYAISWSAKGVSCKQKREHCLSQGVVQMKKIQGTTSINGVQLATADKAKWDPLSLVEDASTSRAAIQHHLLEK